MPLFRGLSLRRSEMKAYVYRDHQFNYRVQKNKPFICARHAKISKETLKRWEKVMTEYDKVQNEILGVLNENNK
jgi:hypothetical protein